jgi:hypothetical protein
MEKIVFNNGTAVLDYDTLKRTVNYEQANGKLPKNRPIEHHKLIEMICDEASVLKNANVEVDSIFCTEKNTLRVMWPGAKDECPVENHLIQRLVTRIHLINKKDKDMNMAVGLSYNEKGLILAFGPNIHICKNQNVFGDNIMSTYSYQKRDKMDFGKIIEVFRAWMLNFEKKKEADYNRIEKMKQVEVPYKEVKLLYGELIESAVLANLDGKFNSPMNQTQVAEFIRNTRDEKYEIPVGEAVNVWNLTQMGTDVLKPQNSDYTNSYHTLNNFNNFIYDKYCL